MAKSKESFGKKEREKKKQKQQADKLEKKLERRAAGQAGKSLDDMLAYVDENGNLSSEPPKETPKAEIDLKDIRIGATPRPPEDPTRTGIVTFFNQTKGFGFISDEKSRQDIFFHINDLLEPVKEKDRVTFTQERNAKGFFATGR